MHGVACISPAHAACGQTDLQSSLSKLATDGSVVPALSPNLYMCPSWWSDLAVLIAVLRVMCLETGDASVFDSAVIHQLDQLLLMKSLQGIQNLTATPANRRPYHLSSIQGMPHVAAYI